MATFAKSSFNSVAYAAGRPQYPKLLYDFIFKYHEGGKGARWDTAVDLGCGTGQATTELTPFKRVIGVDPSAKMIEAAQKHVQSLGLLDSPVQQMSFKQGSAEDLSFFESNSVDLMIAAQAGHWFDWDKMWAECARVLRHGGSAAFWTYSEFRLTYYPTATPLITDYAHGKDERTSLGPHWEQPGRSILQNHLKDVPDPNTIISDGFKDFRRIYFTGSHHPNLPNSLPVILRSNMTWKDLISYLRSFSSLNNFQEKYPEDKDHPEGDMATRFRASLKKVVNAADNTPDREIGEDDTIFVEWPVALLLVKKV